MSKKTIDKVQSYLTVINSDNGKIYQILNVELLLRRHPSEAVISFLQELRNDYSKRLKQLLKKNVSDVEINEIVAKNFRIKMAINTIKNYDKGVKDAA